MRSSPDRRTDKAEPQAPSDAGAVEQQTPGKPTSPTTSSAARQDQGSLDMSYVAGDFCAALVVHPGKI
ncbi:MAG: hypothetical protein ACYS9X_31300, partial [Planctomycetota bacterium]